MFGSQCYTELSGQITHVVAAKVRVSGLPHAADQLILFSTELPRLMQHENEEVSRL